MELSIFPSKYQKIVFLHLLHKLFNQGLEVSVCSQALEAWTRYSQGSFILSLIWGINQGLRQGIFKSGFVIAGGQEGEQMLRSFSHARHALDCSLAVQFSSTLYCHLLLWTTLSYTVSDFVCVCVAGKLYLVSRSNLSQVVEDPITVVMNVATNCQAPHSPHWPHNEEEMFVLVSFFFVCMWNGEFKVVLLLRLKLWLCKRKENHISKREKDINIGYLCVCVRVCVGLCMCVFVWVSVLDLPNHRSPPVAHWGDQGSGGVSARVRGLFTYHDGWEWGHQRGKHFI